MPAYDAYGRTDITKEPWRWPKQQQQANGQSGNPIRDTGMLDLLQLQQKQAPDLSNFTKDQQKSIELAQARTTDTPDQFALHFPNAIPQGGRKTSGYATVQSPQGGTMDVPNANLQRYLDKGYTNYQPPRTAAQQFDLNQAYIQGYGAPSPTIQQGAGGPYRVAGGVASPFTPQNAFQRFGSNLTAGFNTMGTFAANIGSGISKWMGNQNALANRAMSGQTSPQNYAFYNYNPSPLQNQPKRFDFNYF